MFCQYLRPSKIRISLVFLEVWTLHDMINVSRRVRETLTSFLKYRADTMGVVGLDISQLITSVLHHYVCVCVRIDQMD